MYIFFLHTMQHLYVISSTILWPDVCKTVHEGRVNTKRSSHVKTNSWCLPYRPTGVQRRGVYRFTRTRAFSFTSSLFITWRWTTSSSHLQVCIDIVKYKFITLLDTALRRFAHVHCHSGRVSHFSNKKGRNPHSPRSFITGWFCSKFLLW